jgi:ubiquinone/menaquinone biosynthesis C-methylase UbiE
MSEQPHAVHHESNRAFYDRISQAYDTIADASERPARLTGLHLLAVKPGERVLEVGCGTGNELLDLAELVGPGGKVLGIDISPGMLAVAQQKLSLKPLPSPVELLVGDARQLPYEDGSCDAVYSSFTLELFPDDDMATVLREVRRVLRPGGRFGVVSMATVPAGSHPSVLEGAYVWMHRHFPHIVDCRPIDAAAALEAAGYRVAARNDLAIWTMPVQAVVGEKPAGG